MKYYHMFIIIIVFKLGGDKVVCCVFYRLSQGISHGMRLLACEFLLFSYVFPLAYASSLRLCSYRCAEALAVNMKFSIELSL